MASSIYLKGSLLLDMSAPPELENALCASSDIDPDRWTPEGRDTVSLREVFGVCRKCPSNDACLLYALEHPDVVGVWGGYLFQGGQHGMKQRERLKHVA